MHFELKTSNQKSFLKSRHFLNIIVIGFIAVLIFGSALFDNQGNFEIDPVMGPIFIGAFFIALVVFLKKQKSFQAFDVDEAGVQINNKKYFWSEMKKYHLLGESQSERFGSTKLVDVVNPYKHTVTQIFRIKMKNRFFNSWLNLEVDKERVDELKTILTNHNVVRTSKWHLLVGI